MAQGRHAESRWHVRRWSRGTTARDCGVRRHVVAYSGAGRDPAGHGQEPGRECVAVCDDGEQGVHQACREGAARVEERRGDAGDFVFCEFAGFGVVDDRSNDLE